MDRATLELTAAALREKLTRRQAPAGSVDVVQHESRRSVCVLRGAGPKGGDVYAKRCRASTAQHERFIYEQVLPRLPLPCLEVYGLHIEPETDYAWLLVEDAAGESYDGSRPEHRTLAGEWLGRMHTAAVDLNPPGALRDAGPAGFRQHLPAARRTIEEARENPVLGRPDLRMLEVLDRQLREMASHWHEMEAFCRWMPRTLVHGDFKEHNMRVRASGARPVLLLFDWSDGGWGVPALDVAKFLGYSVSPDLRSYHSVVVERWPHLDIDSIRRLGYVGEACRSVVSVRWEVERLRYEWVERPLARLRYYVDWLREVLTAEPWRERPRSGRAARKPSVKSWY